MFYAYLVSLLFAALLILVLFYPIFPLLWSVCAFTVPATGFLYNSVLKTLWPKGHWLHAEGELGKWIYMPVSSCCKQSRANGSYEHDRHTYL